ncbi:WD repeat-containing protein 87-like [Senna tora]|uniref:WD repeat-containing protein 87-like n=1 Tax=Senna tora TaxID=362788 RepID=A0A834T8D0_9FABA|nr:WD repeat-containing protein 87-like [Senna tora]
MEHQVKSHHHHHHHHHIESITKTHYLIKLTQLLVSVSLCSFLFSPSSLLAFFTHTIDKNCMFLLCNGLLVFSEFSHGEAKEIRMLEKDGDDDDEQNICAEQVIEIKYCDDEVEVVEEDSIEKAIVEDHEEEEEIENSQAELGIEESGKLDEGFQDKLEEEEEIEEEEEEDDEEEEENCMLSTEELNKKFDEFIRRMREDLRLEAQRQLIMV